VNTSDEGRRTLWGEPSAVMSYSAVRKVSDVDIAAAISTADA
jgi:hypothetical protein